MYHVEITCIKLSLDISKLQTKEFAIAKCPQGLTINDNFHCFELRLGF